MPSVLRDPYHLEILEEAREEEQGPVEAFDRVAFALKALDVLKPSAMTVAVYRGHGKIHVRRVRDLRRGEGATWAMVGIPPRASRAQIAYALAELAGLADRPFLVDALVAADHQSAV